MNYKVSTGRIGEDQEYVEYRKPRVGAYIAQVTKHSKDQSLNKLFSKNAPQGLHFEDIWYVYESMNGPKGRLRTVAFFKNKEDAVLCAYACAQVKWD